MSFTLLDWSAIICYLAITLNRYLLSSKFRQEFRRLLRIRTKSVVVVGRHFYGGYNLCSRHTSPCRWPGLHARNCGELDLVGLFAVRDDDCVPFARLWRRSGLMTDVQFAEMRYSGKPAAFLRGFRAIYLGLLMNCLILGWVTKAMINIVGTTLGPTMQSWRLLGVFSSALTRVFGPAFSGTDGRR